MKMPINTINGRKIGDFGFCSKFCATSRNGATKLAEKAVFDPDSRAQIRIFTLRGRKNMQNTVWICKIKENTIFDRRILPLSVRQKKNPHPFLLEKGGGGCVCL